MAIESTKEHLLDAAVEVFASKSFKDATLAEICERAGANGAAVNYHFGSKEALLKHAIEQAFRIAESRYPLRGNLDASASPEERLKTFMEAVILRSFDTGPAGQFERIIGHEMAQRSDKRSSETFDEIRNIHDETLDSILEDLIQAQTRAEFIQARIAVISLCVFQNTVPSLRDHLFPDSPSPAVLRRYVDRQVAFALAGLATYSKNTSKCKPTPLSAASQQV